MSIEYLPIYVAYAKAQHDKVDKIWQVGSNYPRQMHGILCEEEEEVKGQALNPIFPQVISRKLVKLVPFGPRNMHLLKPWHLYIYREFGSNVFCPQHSKHTIIVSASTLLLVFEVVAFLKQACSFKQGPPRNRQIGGPYLQMSKLLMNEVCMTLGCKKKTKSLMRYHLFQKEPNQFFENLHHRHDALEMQMLRLCYVCTNLVNKGN